MRGRKGTWARAGMEADRRDAVSTELARSPVLILFSGPGNLKENVMKRLLGTENAVLYLCVKRRRCERGKTQTYFILIRNGPRTLVTENGDRGATRPSETKLVPQPRLLGRWPLSLCNPGRNSSVFESLD